MNEVYEALTGLLEDLRCESDEREYSVKTEEMRAADEELKRRIPEYEKCLERMPEQDRTLLEHYMEVVDHAHFQEEQRAYYQGIVDAIQMMEGMGLIQKSKKVNFLLGKLRE